ncbi:hypothetical protein [Streptomyces sp. x-80]
MPQPVKPPDVKRRKERLKVALKAAMALLTTTVVVGVGVLRSHQL